MRINKILLWADMVVKDIFHILMLTVMIAILTCVNINTLYEYKRFNDVLRQKEKYNIEDAYFYYLTTDELCIYRDELDQLLQKCSSSSLVDQVYWTGSFADSNGIMNHVPKSLEEIMENGFIPMDKYKKLAETLDGTESTDAFLTLARACQKEDGALYMPITLSTGEEIDRLEKNQIILDESAKKDYRVGDTVKIICEKNANYLFVGEAEVAGFVSENEIIPYSSLRSESMESLFTTIRDLKEEDGFSTLPEEERFYIPSYYGIVSEMTDPEGNSDMITSQSKLVILPKEGVSVSDLEKELDGVLRQPDMLFPYAKLEKNYTSDHGVDIRWSKVFLLSAAIISLTIFVSVLFRCFTEKRNELLTYYTLGLKWPECILISVTPYLLSIVVGWIVGLNLWKWYLSTHYIWVLDYGNRNKVSLLMIYLVVYGLSSLVYYFLYSRKNPIELKKSKE